MAARGWGKSKVTKEALIPYVAAGIIPEFKRERWRVPSANEVSDLGPHSVQQIALFVALCECYLGCPPYFPLWVSIFHGRATRASEVRNFIDMALPKKAQSQWRKFWFYALEYTPPGGVPIPQYTPEPSVPRRLNVRSLPKDQEEVVKGMRQRSGLKDSGLTANTIVGAAWFLSLPRPPHVGVQRANDYKLIV
ncbi:hypothetical protein QYE76_001634 [Lolium multiflorum]|uniref:Transposase (putative) gypsy type domain-containing protein n=1 Tax=Lolium multiflorum TaxID=4521 RepID=A0AAD8VYS7_LOLMU|nr:hypothetical protein QYE76_001634 [Lolium multiflorum]